MVVFLANIENKSEKGIHVVVFVANIENKG